MKVLDKKIENKTYTKYRINLPKEAVENSNLFNVELKIKFDNERIIIEREEDKLRPEDIEKNLTEKQKIVKKELIKLLKERKKEK